MVTKRNQGFIKRRAVDTIGTRLRQWRKLQGLKLYRFAELVKLSQGSLSDLENNISCPSARTLCGLMLFTDINIHWLILGKGEMNRNESKAPGTV